MSVHCLGWTNGSERICEEAYQAEPARQHQQQGKEKNKELHDDETQSEHQNKRQTLLQRETGIDIFIQLWLNDNEKNILATL